LESLYTASAASSSAAEFTQQVSLFRFRIPIVICSVGEIQ
jgi:hypothetical protein